LFFATDNGEIAQFSKYLQLPTVKRILTIFFTFVKNVRVPDKGVRRAGPGPRAIAWRGLPRLVAYTGDSMFEAAYPKFLMIFSELPGEHLGSICKQGMIVSFQILVT
jgi:hypothetical protein